MKSTKMSTIFVLGLGMMFWSASVTSGAQYLTVNGQDVNSITLELGQSWTVEVVSTDSTSYVAYAGFDNGVVRGTFSYLETKAEAGNLATVLGYEVPAFYGYYVNATGIAPAPSAGVHFVFEHVAQELGTTYVKLYDSTLTSEIDSVYITVIPLSPKPTGTAFTYQGRLLDVNSPADGLYDLQFKLFDNADPVFAAQQGSTIDANNLDVIDGYFTVELDFGSGIFYGDARWLEIGVRPGDSNDPNAFATLNPRTELTPTPYAIYALEANGLTLPYSGSASSSDAAFSMTNTGIGYVGHFEQTGSANANGVLNVTTAAGQYGAKILNQGGFTNGYSYGLHITTEKNTGGRAYGIRSIASNDGSYAYGLSAEATSTNSSAYGGSFRANTSGFSAYGITIDANTTRTISGESFGIKLYSDCVNGTAYGVWSDVGVGSASASDLYGIYSYGNHLGTAGTSYGMYSRVFGSNAGDSYGIYSEGNKSSLDSAGTAYGGYFIGDNDRTDGNSVGLYTKATGLDGDRYGLYSDVTTSSGNYRNYGVKTQVANNDGFSYGLYADLDPGERGYGVYVNLDTTTACTSSQRGFYSFVNHHGTSGHVLGVQSHTYSSDTGKNYAGYFWAHSEPGDTGDLYGIYSTCDNDTSGSNYAGYFIGNVHIDGTLTKSSGSFKIDHPLDPENKYLSHSFVESPDMMNVYNGNAALDENGEAFVQLPEYFEALNRDFRYQLTAIGAPAPNLYIAEKISDNRFKISGGKPGMEVSWQVTGVRHDPHAVAHRVQVEEEKKDEERGYYLDPMAYGLPEEKGIESVRNPQVSETRQVAKGDVSDEQNRQ